MAGKKQASPLDIPNATLAAAYYGALLDQTDLDRIIDAVGLPVTADERVDLSAAISTAVDMMFLADRGQANPTECAAWLRQVQERAAAVLACFPGALAAERAQWVLRGPNGYLDDPRLPADRVDARIEAALSAAAELAMRASVAAAAWEKHKRPGRQSPQEELEFFHALLTAYKKAFGRDGVATNTEGERVGPASRFFMEIGFAVRGKGFDPQGYPALLRLLNPNSVADRVREARRGAMSRKRPSKRQRHSG